MSKEAHSRAINSFNSNHQDYDAFRPSFSKDIVDPFLVSLGLAEINPDKSYKFHTDKTILEIAAGTGKFTKNLVDNGWGNSKDNSNLIIVEASQGMLDSLKVNFPQIKSQNIHHTSSYNIPLEDNSVDSVLIAQAFHWFADIQSLKEIHRVLKPSGTLGLIWNFDNPSSKCQVSTSNAPSYINGNSEFFDSLDFDSHKSPYQIFLDHFNNAPWNNKVSQLFYSCDLEVPQYRRGVWRELLESSDNTYFGPFAEEIYLLYESLISPDEVFKYWETRSYITDLSDEEKNKLKEKVEQIIAEDVDSKTPQKNGKLLKPMVTHAVVVPVKK